MQWVQLLIHNKYTIFLVSRLLGYLQLYLLYTWKHNRHIIWKYDILFPNKFILCFPIMQTLSISRSRWQLRMFMCMNVYEFIKLCTVCYTSIYTHIHTTMNRIFFNIYSRRIMVIYILHCYCMIYKTICHPRDS